MGRGRFAAGNGGLRGADPAFAFTNQNAFAETDGHGDVPEAHADSPPGVASEMAGSPLRNPQMTQIHTD